SSHRWPQLLPDGSHFLYLGISHDRTKSENDALYWASLDGRENRMLMRSGANAIFASGNLLYVRDTNLVAQPFDPARGELRGVPARFTFNQGTNEFLPTWSPDGRRVAFSSDRSGHGAIYIKESSGGADEELLQQSGEPQRIADWSADGRFILYEQGDPSKG